MKTIKELNKTSRESLRRGIRPFAVLFLWVISHTTVPASTQLTCGESTNGTIAAAATQTYTFSGNAGEVLLLPIFGEPGYPLYFNAVADVYDPSLTLLWSTTNGGWMARTLTNTGKYTVVVHADNYANTGTYGISLAFVTGRCGAAPIAIAPITGAVTRAAEIHPFAFRGNAGDVVQFSISGEPGYPLDFNAVARIFSPLGHEIAACTNGPTTSLNLTNSGIYTVTVQADTFANVGAYGMSVLALTAAPAPVGLSISSTNRAADLTLWGQLGNTTMIQYVTNLASTNVWLTLTNINLSWSPCQFIDWSSTNVAQRFYRQVQVQ